MRRPPLLTARNRLRLAAAAVALIFLGLSARAATLAGLSVQDPAATPMVGHAPPAPVTERRMILDRNGEILALSVKTVALGALPTRVRDPWEIAQRLKTVFEDLDPAYIVQRLDRERFVYLRQGLTPQEQKDVLYLGLPALEFRETETRRYPRGRLTAHLTGFTRIDNVGQAGVERRFESFLNTADEDLVLTIDSRLQAMVREALQSGIDAFEAKGGMAVVLDADTAEVLAAVSLPDYDPNRPADERENWLSGLTGSYEMGSTFKLFTTALALESGVWKVDDTVDTMSPLTIGGFRIRDFKPPRHNYTIAESLIYSSNIGSVRMMEAVGRDRQRVLLAKLGLLSPLDAGLSIHAEPQIPPPGWSRISAATVSYGHGISVSPLHLAAAAAAMVNGGIYRTPTVLKTEGLIERAEYRVISQQTSDDLRRLLYLVPREGTASLARADGYLVGGKTGTSEKVVTDPETGRRYYSKRRDMNFSSFLGAFPLNDPRFVILVNVDEPKPQAHTHGRATGGWVAAPIFKEIVERMAPLYAIAPVDEDDPFIQAEMQVNWTHHPKSSGH